MGRIIKDNRALVYCGLNSILSLVSLPEDYKIDKGNPLNQWFVKLGWFWTNALLLPLLFLSIETSDREAVSNAILRLFASTFLWYTSVNLFEVIDSFTGFDISGHTFLLMFSNLLITSELKLVDSMTTLTKSKTVQAKQTELHLFIVRVSLFVLTVLWDFMLLQTALFYHTLIQKLIATVWALASWYILHVLFYHKYQSEPETRGRTPR